jgi:hypothetical protein
MRDPNDPERPMVVLPVKYIEEVKWIPENRVSFWKHIDKVRSRRTTHIVTDIGTNPTDSVFTSNLSSLKSADLVSRKKLPSQQGKD